MSAEMVMTLGRESLVTVLLLTAPILGLGLLVGLLVSLFQATTQINEQSLAFIPKILVVILSIFLFGPWMLNTMMDFTLRVFARIPDLVR
ncbi:MAG: flagellar biosynthesis protein FliQ [Bacillota bacterium]|nr:flagellar biosynthesis protein FliQ [Bacillota bacterium]PZN36853.1 MAG: flagellar biosynthetic protein FliQ [Bacillota bacterium]